MRKGSASRCAVMLAHAHASAQARVLAMPAGSIGLTFVLIVLLQVVKGSIMVLEQRATNTQLMECFKLKLEDDVWLQLPPFLASVLLHCNPLLRWWRKGCFLPPFLQELCLKDLKGRRDAACNKLLSPRSWHSKLRSWNA